MAGWHTILVGTGLIVGTLPLTLAEAAQLLSVTGAPLPDPSVGGGRCEHIYVDLGANVGVQPRAFFEPEAYADNYAQKYFSAIFGDGDARRARVCVFSFEANPRHSARLAEIERCYRAKGWRLWFFPRVALDCDGCTVPIFSDNSNHELHWGSGISTALVRDRSDAGMSVDDVATIDIVQWLDQLLYAHKPQYVFVKMDIEGSEYVVLPHMHARGLLCAERITGMDIEWHNVALKELEQRYQDAWQEFTDAGKLSWVRSPQLRPVFTGTCHSTFVIPFSTEDELHDTKALPCEGDQGDATAPPKSERH